MVTVKFLALGTVLYLDEFVGDTFVVFDAELCLVHPIINMRPTQVI